MPNTERQARRLAALLELSKGTSAHLATDDAGESWTSNTSGDFLEPNELPRYVALVDDKDEGYTYLCGDDAVRELGWLIASVGSTADGNPADESLLGVYDLDAGREITTQVFTRVVLDGEPVADELVHERPASR